MLNDDVIWCTMTPVLYQKLVHTLKTLKTELIHISSLFNLNYFSVIYTSLLLNKEFICTLA